MPIRPSDCTNIIWYFGGIGTTIIRGQWANVARTTVDVGQWRREKEHSAAQMNGLGQLQLVPAQCSLAISRSLGI